MLDVATRLCDPSSLTVRQAEVHLAQIVATFGQAARLDAVVRSEVVGGEAEGARAVRLLRIRALHSRLSQVMSDAVHDGILARNPCSRRTSPGAGSQRPYVAAPSKARSLHDGVPGHLQPAILLGAFVGLRTAEARGLLVHARHCLPGAAVAQPGVEDRDLTYSCPDPVGAGVAFPRVSAATICGTTSPRF